MVRKPLASDRIPRRSPAARRMARPRWRLVDLGHWLARILQGLLALALLGVWMGITNRFAQPDTFPVARVELLGPRLQTHEPALEQAVRDELLHGWFQLGLAAVRHDLRALPWIAEARVRRVWPNGLRLEIREWEAAARWNADRVISASGHVFEPPPASIPNELPRLTGQADRASSLWQRFRDWDTSLKPLDLRLERLMEDARGACRVVLNNGLEVRLGRNDPDARFARFRQWYPEVVADRAGTIRYLDMRHSSGFAIGWHDRGHET